LGIKTYKGRVREAGEDPFIAFFGLRRSRWVGKHELPTSGEEASGAAQAPGA